VSLQLRAAIGTTSTELFIIKDGDGRQGDVVLLPRKAAGGRARRGSMAAGDFDAAASWLVQDWSPPSGGGEEEDGSAGDAYQAGEQQPLADGVPGAVP